MSKEEIIPAASFEKLPIEDEINIGCIVNDIESILHGKASIHDNNFKSRAEETLVKLQSTSEWLYRLRQIDRTRLNELQGSMLTKIKAIFKRESVKAQIDELDKKVMANQELNNIYGEIIIHLENLLKKYPSR